MFWWVALVVKMKLNNDEWVRKSMDFKYSYVGRVENWTV
jgi:hypothetical protein